MGNIRYPVKTKQTLATDKSQSPIGAAERRYHTHKGKRVHSEPLSAKVFQLTSCVPATLTSRRDGAVMSDRSLEGPSPAEPREAARFWAPGAAEAEVSGQPCKLPPPRGQRARHEQSSSGSRTFAELAQLL